jgi:hypothetical protein
MLILTTWKSRPLTPEQSKRMMAVWGTQLESHATNPVWNELFWVMSADGSSGASLTEAADPDVAARRSLQICLELGEFVDIETKVVVDQSHAMAPILAAMATVGA